MKDRLFIYFAVCCGVMVIAVCATVIFHMGTLTETKVVFLDVGQGDAILISHGTDQILIDGGPDGTVLLEELAKHIPFWDRTIEIVVATHPDSDHIDGLISVFDAYHVEQLWYTDAPKDTATQKQLIYRTQKEDGVELIQAYHGLTALMNNAKLEVIYPYSDDITGQKDVNNTSIVTLFTFGDEIFYFGGDATSDIEELLPIEKITVLKASHHGSASSTSQRFLNRVHPRDVVISSGEGNRYGHPHGDVLERVLRSGAQIFRTDQERSIEYNCVNNSCRRVY